MLAVISHDAGGAEILSSFVRRNSQECLFVLDGPARKIFERKLGEIRSGSLEDVVSKATTVLCGTSWQSDLELRGIKLARLQGKPSAAFIDHWVNYLERFTCSGQLVLPDEILVGDSLAQALASDAFPGLPIRLVSNPYFKDIQEELAGLSVQRVANSPTLSVLYVCEPVREHALKQYGNERYWGYVEEDALRYFLSGIEALGKPVDSVVIRPHPSESLDKYEWAKTEYNVPIHIGGIKSLLEEIASSDVVVGCQSMAMVIGLLAGKRVVSSIPPGGPPCALRQTEIEKFQILIEQQRTP